MKTYSAIVLVIMVFLSQPLLSDTICLNSGQFKNDFTILNEVVNNTLVKKARIGVFGNVIQPQQSVRNPGIYGKSSVKFSGQNIELLAFANNTTFTTVLRKVESFARGKLFVDFAIDCGSTIDDTVTATVALKVKILGRIVTFYPGSKAAFNVAVRIKDLTANCVIDYRSLESQSVGNLLGSFKTVAKLPVVTPQLAGSEISPIETFVVQLRRGRTYRFELFAAARSTSGYVSNPGSTSFARVDFEKTFTDVVSELPGVELVDFSIDVASVQSTDLILLKKIVDSLKHSILNFGSQLNALGESFRLQLSDIDDSAAEQREIIIKLQAGQLQNSADLESINISLQELTARFDALEDEINEQEHSDDHEDKDNDKKKKKD